MGKEESVLHERVENVKLRLDAVHTGFRKLDDDFRQHDKVCTERWTESSIKLKAIVWGIRTLGGGVLIMLLKDIWEVLIWCQSSGRLAREGLKVATRI